MNKAVLISIKPELCKLIADGEKTIEVRKTKPNLKPPFKCYIYQTKGKVIGEFVCDKIDEILPDYCPVKNKFSYSRYRKLKNTMLDENEILDYGKGKWLYGWHISDLKIYDKPKELREFKITRPPQSWCYVEDYNKKGEVEKMRDYLFRGKRKGVGEWVYGELLHRKTKSGSVITEIHTLDMFYEVDPETVGQYTGLKDKNDKKIFEGDIVIYRDSCDYLNVGQITYETSAGAFLCVSGNDELDEVNYEFFDNMFNIEVIGNIHDNPELLKNNKKNERIYGTFRI